MIRRALVVVLTGWAGLSTAEQGDPVVPFAQSDPTMNAAIAEAQRTLPLFLCESVDNEGYGPEGGYLKVEIPVQHAEMSDEIIWVGPFAAWNGKDFSGLLANEPHALPGLGLGDQIDFTYDMIVDWSWGHPSGAQYGDYTTRVILRQLGDEAALARLSVPEFDDSWRCN